MTPTAELIQPEIQELVREGAYSELRDALHGIPPADVADIISSLEPDQAAICFRFLPLDLCLLMLLGGMAVGCLGGLLAASVTES